MKILVFNCGSSSIKYQLFDMPESRVLAKGAIERIGEEVSTASQQTDRGTLELEKHLSSHKEGLELATELLIDRDKGALASLAEIGACGHRIVHGGEAFTGSVIINEELEQVVEEFCDLAPLHNPPNLSGVRAARRLLGQAPQVACFDTAFHQSIPETAYLYALPNEFYEKHRVRRYGFHGTSHKYVTARAAALLGKALAEVKVITCHLGNGCSITAVRNGRSVDTSMGFTPLQGVVMGTRAGDFDPAILFYLIRQGYTPDELDSMVNKKSGLLGISGSSNDMRDLEEKAGAGDRRATLALDMFAYSIKKYIGAYLAVLNGCQAVVFTGGIGEHRAAMRQRIIENMDCLGLALDEAKNLAGNGRESEVGLETAKIRIFVIPTDEERVIAAETYAVVTANDQD